MQTIHAHARNAGAHVEGQPPAPEVRYVVRLPCGGSSQRGGAMDHCCQGGLFPHPGVAERHIVGITMHAICT